MKKIELITKTLIESNLMTVPDLKANLWLFTHDPEDIAVKTLRIKQLMTLNDMDATRAPSWFINNLFAFNLQKIPKLINNYKKDTYCADAKAMENFNERLEFLSALFNVETLEMVPKIERYPFLITLSDAELTLRFQILKEEASMDDANLQKRLHLLESSPELLRGRIRMFKEKGVPFSPYMFRLSHGRMRKLFSALDAHKMALGGEDANNLTYLASELKIAPEEVLLMAAKETRIDLLSVNAAKLKAMIETLLSAGYEKQEIATHGARVFEYSVPFVTERIRQYKEATNQRPPFSLFWIGNDRFKNILKSKQGRQHGVETLTVIDDAAKRIQMKDVMKISRRLDYEVEQDAK